MRFVALLTVLFLSGATPTPPAPRGIAITRIVVNRLPYRNAQGTSWDRLSDPDLIVAIEVEGRAQLRSGVVEDYPIRGLPLTWDLQLAFAFAEGQRVRITVWDKDVTGEELVAASDFLSTRALANYLGQPQELTGTDQSSFTVNVAASF